MFTYVWVIFDLNLLVLHFRLQEHTKLHVCNETVYEIVILHILIDI